MTKGLLSHEMVAEPDRLLKEYQLTEHKRVLRLLSVVPMGLREVATRNTKIYGNMARLSIPACSTRLSSSTC